MNLESRHVNRYTYVTTILLLPRSRCSCWKCYSLKHSSTEMRNLDSHYTVKVGRGRSSTCNLHVWLSQRSRLLECMPQFMYYKAKTIATSSWTTIISCTIRLNPQHRCFRKDIDRDACSLSAMVRYNFINYISLFYSRTFFVSLEPIDYLY
jgi:hypothetical protein